MNILIIVSSLTGGGAERVAASWANGLIKRGNNVGVVTDYSKPVTYKIDTLVDKIPLPSSSKNKLARLLFDPIKKIKYYRKVIKNFNPDAILTVLHIAPISIKLAILGLKNKPLFILTDHNAYERPATSPMSSIEKFNKFHLNRIYDLVTVLTRRDKDILTTKNYHNVEVLHNPLFLEPVNQIPHKQKIILAVGRMDAWQSKGFDLLLKAWNRLYFKFPDWKLRIVGDSSPSNLNYLKSISDNPDSVEFINYTDSIEEEYKEASIFILSSRYEGWGLVLVEAMSQGCAAIACDYKGRQAEIIKESETGILIEPDNIDEMTKAIELLITDSNLRLTLQKHAPEAVRQFSEENIANQWLEILNNYR